MRIDSHKKNIEMYAFWALKEASALESCAGEMEFGEERDSLNNYIYAVRSVLNSLKGE